MTGSYPFLPVLDSSLQTTSGRYKQGRRGWPGETLLTGLAVQERSHQHCPTVRRPQEGFCSTGPHVSAYNGVDTGLITVQRKNISACHQREEHRLMEEEEALGTLCMHGCTVSYRAHYHSSLLETRPGEHCSQQNEEEQTLFSRNHYDLTKHQ